MTTRDFTIDEFSPALGETFDLDIEGRRIGLELDRVQALPKSVREAGSFRLEFRGPPDLLLPQAIYRLERCGEAWDIFIVPIALDGEGATYEAIFN